MKIELLSLAELKKLEALPDEELLHAVTAAERATIHKSWSSGSFRSTENSNTLRGHVIDEILELARKYPDAQLMAARNGNYEIQILVSGTPPADPKEYKAWVKEELASGR